MSEERTRLLETVDSFSTAMLTTMSPEGVLHARPMHLAGREDRVLWFATSAEGMAVAEIRAFGQANASFQSALVYVSVAGPATIVQDRSKIEALWTDTWAAWFPAGPQDPDLVLVRLDGRSADIWDLRGTSGLKAAFRALGAMVGRRVEALTGSGTQHIPL